MRIILTVIAFLCIGCRSDVDSRNDPSFIRLDFSRSYSWSAEKMHPAIGSLNACVGDSCAVVYSRANNFISTAIASQDMKIKFQITSANEGNTYNVFLNYNGTPYSCENISSSIIFSNPIQPAESGSPDAGFAVGEFNYIDICGSGISILGDVKAIIY